MAFHINELHGENTIPDAIEPIVRMGWMGVDLFFVLSGYLIGQQLLRPYAQGSKASVWAFYVKRFFRVLPAYSVVLSLYLAWPLWREAPRMAAPWQYYTFTENYFVNYPYERAFSHVWSLCVEEHFYFFLPLIVVLLAYRPSSKKTASALGVFVLFGIAVRAFILYHTLQPLDGRGESWLIPYVKQIYYPTYSRLDGLLAGVSLALIKTFRPEWWSVLSRRGHSLFAGGLSLFAFATWITWHRFESVRGVSAFGLVFGFPILSLGLGLIVASALSNNGLLSRYKIPGARIVSALAFTLYLSHKGIVHLTEVYFPAISAAGGISWIALFLVSAFIAAAILYLCIERPFMILRDRLLHQHKQSVEQELQTEPAI